MSLKFTAVGDILIQKRFPGEYQGFKEIKQYISRGDFRFFNLETTINDGKVWASQFCGGSYLRTNKSSLDDIGHFGFNVVSICNNHSMDFSHKGLLSTKKSIEEKGLIQSGVGENLGEASAPAYLDTLAGRVAIIGVTSSFYAPARAGAQSRRFIGRPGVNALRYDEIYEIPHLEMQQIKKIAEITQINSRNQIRRKEGYLRQVSSQYFDFNGHLFFEGNNPGRKSVLDENDMARIEKSIFEAKLQSDYIIISLHSHQMRNGKKECPDFFNVDFAHRCIDLGANAIVGHGPHILRGIEIYKDCPIFYSLGNFIFHNENIPYAPEEFYDTYGLNSDATMHELFAKRSDNFKQGLQRQRTCFESIIPFWEIKNGKLKSLEFMPIELGFEKKCSVNGWPQKSSSDQIVKKVQKLSEEFGTNILYKDGKGAIQL